MNRASDPLRLFSERSQSYVRFIQLARYPQGLCSYFRASPLLRPNLRVLDAGCGTGVLTLALRDALISRGFQPQTLKGFDLTPRMLEAFRENLRTGAIEGVDIVQADVLQLETLSADWKNFDLIVTASMLEYLPPERLVDVLQGLRSWLNEAGSLVFFITRNYWLMRALIGPGLPFGPRKLWSL